MTTLPCMQRLNLREKLLTNGPDRLSDLELLAIFIGSGNSRKSCLQLAQELIHNFGDLRGVLNSEAQSFNQIPGLGLVRYSQLQAMREICRRSDFISLQKQMQLKSTQDTHVFLKRQLRDKKNETVAALFLDNQYRVISYEEIFQGTINASMIHTRPLIERVLQLNAAALILAHNHPSGWSEASEEDFKVTKRLQKALQLVDTTLLDHLVIGDNEVFSILNHLKWRCH